MHVVPPKVINVAARPLDAFLNTTGGLARVAAHAGRLLKLQRAFSEIAPPYLAAACRVANFKPGKVVIHADSGAVAARLRQMLPRLADEFCKKGCEVTEIEVKVQPAHAAMQHAERPAPREVGADTKAGLATLAGSLPEGSALRGAVEHLVRKAR